MRPLRQQAQQLFPLLETRAITTISANIFAVAGADPYTYTVGKSIGVEQSGIIRPMSVVKCRYNSANARMELTVSGKLDTGKSIRVWKPASDAAYYTLGGGFASIPFFLPGGQAIGTTPFNAGKDHLGFGGSFALSTLGSNHYSNARQRFGENTLIVDSTRGYAWGAASGSIGSQITYDGGWFMRASYYIESLTGGYFHPIYRWWQGGGADYKGWYLGISASDRRILAIGNDYGGGGTYLSQWSTGTVPTFGGWFDFAAEMDAANSKVRIWIEGVPTIQFNSASVGYLGGPFAIMPSSFGFNSYSGVFSAAAGTGAVVHVHDYLVLNYAPILTDGITLPAVTKPFAYPGLKDAF